MILNSIATQVVINYSHWHFSHIDNHCRKFLCQCRCLSIYGHMDCNDAVNSGHKDRNISVKISEVAKLKQHGR